VDCFPSECTAKVTHAMLSVCQRASLHGRGAAMQGSAAFVCKAAAWLLLWPVLIALYAVHWLGLPLPSWHDSLVSKRKNPANRARWLH
jgi:hypothetical protein